MAGLCNGLVCLCSNGPCLSGPEGLPLPIEDGFTFLIQLQVNILSTHSMGLLRVLQWQPDSVTILVQQNIRSLE